MFAYLFSALFWFLHWLQPIFVPLGMITAWTLVILLGWSLWTTLRDGVANAQHLHRIPCADCRFFTGDYHLKCSIHPSHALSEVAINCPDYETDAIALPPSHS